MKKILIIALFLSIGTFAQEKVFVLSKDGLTDYVVQEIPNKTAAEMYSKTIEWITRTYNSPKDVIKADIKDDYIRFEGSEDRLACRNSLGMKYCGDAKYQIEVSFKDGKYKFDIISLTMVFPGLNYKKEDVINEDKSMYFKNDGTVRAMFKDYPVNIGNYFNSLNANLSDFISGKATESKKNDW